jgi:hypothetical protein
LTDTETGDEQVLYAGGDSGFEDQVGTYEFGVTESQCGSTVDSKSTAQSLAYDGSLGGVSSKAATGSRFQLRVETDDTIPVELNEFKGSVDRGDVVLEWTTASEQNNAGFQIQQQKDGRFVDLEGAFVDGAGTTSNLQRYSYRVEDLTLGQHTFRLKQVDTEGTTSFSKEVSVRVGLSGQYTLKAYPNPISQQATIEFAVKDAQDVTVEVYNTLGQRVEVLHQGTVSAERLQTVKLQADDLASGLYIVRMRGDSFSTTQSITVVR